MATSERWRCTTCGRDRDAGDALPPLREGLLSKYKHGKCKKCRAERIFERSPGLAGPRDLAEGERRAERGMAIAETNQAIQNPDWSARVDATIKALALSRREFTSEDVTAKVGMPPSGSGSAVGSRINAAARRGVMLWTGRMAKSERPQMHAALLKIWRGA